VTIAPRKKNVVGPRVAEARGRSTPPLTQDALSGKLAGIGIQIDRAAIAKIESDRRYVLDFELKALARVLGVSAEWLLGGQR